MKQKFAKQLKSSILNRWTITSFCTAYYNIYILL